MKRLIFVRHGESEANARDLISNSTDLYPLTKKGVDQVEFISKQISALRITAIYSSPLLRTRQTADILAEKFGIGVEIDDDLRETDFGTMRETKLAGRVVDLPEEIRVKHGVESWNSHRQRLERSLSRMSDRSIVVTHGLVIRTVIGKVLGLDMEEFNGIYIRPSSMTTVDTDSYKLYSVGNFLVSERIKELFS